MCYNISMKKSTILYTVIPCYNESECLSKTTELLSQKIHDLISKKQISEKSRIVYIDDGSKDNTWSIIQKLGKNHPQIIGIKLSRNFGHQNALLAGLMYAKDHCDAAISMDADLQDDINAIDKFIEKFNNSAEIVYGVRSERKKDSSFKKHSALLFYKIMNKLGANTVYNHADYRLMSKRALEELSKFQEVNLFLRGIVPTIGLKTATVKYSRAERFAGESKYPLKKMINFAVDGITSFSIKPIRLIFLLGIIVSFISFIILCYAVIVKLIGQAVSGWTFTICSIWLLGGVQMIALGIIGEYIGKIYSEVKHRPRYTIEEISSSQ